MSLLCTCLLLGNMTTPSIARLATECFDQLDRHIESGGQRKYALHGLCCCLPAHNHCPTCAGARGAVFAVSVEHLSCLGLLLGKHWQKALAIVDAGDVQCLQGDPSRRRAYQASICTRAFAVLRAHMIPFVPCCHCTTPGAWQLKDLPDASRYLLLLPVILL